MISVVIMASGFSRRMGKDKLIMDVCGKPMIARVIEAALEADVGKVSIVSHSSQVFDIASAYSADVIDNPWAFLGQSAGIRLAIEELMPKEAVLFMAGDQPLINPLSIQGIVARFRDERPDIVASSWKGQRVLPTLFSSALNVELLTLSGDRGGRDLIRSNAYRVLLHELISEEEAWDADEPEDLVKLIEKCRGR